MSARKEIEKLDRMIQTRGQDVTIRRVVQGKPSIDRPSRAFVRGYAPAELTSGMKQYDSTLVISPTEILSPFAESDEKPFDRGDRVVINGRVRHVEAVERVRMAGTLVRLNVAVRG